MSSCIHLMILVEGRTESRFVTEIFADYLAAKGIFAHPTLLSKPGQKGGDVKFSRAIRDIGNHLKERADSYVSTFIDYYGLKEWPCLEDTRRLTIPREIAAVLNTAAADAIAECFEAYQSRRRFIPFVAVHEFESLLFSGPAELARTIGVDEADVNSIIAECGEPEKINNSRETAPSKRLEKLCASYKKTVNGITAAKEIGIDKMREHCPVFNSWVSKLESLTG